MLDQNWRYWCEFIGIQCICRNLWKYGCQSLYVCIYVFIYIYSLALSPESAWEQWYRNSTGYTQYPDLGFYSPFSARRNQGSLRKVYFKGLCREHMRWVVPGKTSRFFLAWKAKDTRGGMEQPSHTVHWVLKAGTLTWFAIPFFSGPVHWPPDTKNWLIGKDPDSGKDWGQEEKGTTEDEMVGWHHWPNRHEFEQTLGAGDGQDKPGMLQSMGLQRVGRDWATELNWWDSREALISVLDQLRFVCCYKRPS